MLGKLLNENIYGVEKTLFQYIERRQIFLLLKTNNKQIVEKCTFYKKKPVIRTLSKQEETRLEDMLAEKCLVLKYFKNGGSGRHKEIKINTVFTSYMHKAWRRRCYCVTPKYLADSRARANLYIETCELYGVYISRDFSHY